MFRRPTPYDYLIEIENKKQKSNYKARLQELQLTLDDVKNHETLDVKEAANSKQEYEDSLIYIQNIRITNIRCVKNISFDLEISSNQPALVVAIIGDNSIGKSTILKTISLGITDESGCIALMKAENGKYITKGKKEGKIEITLINKATNEKYIIITKIIIDKNSGEEVVRKEFRNCDPIYLKRNIFVCGYGSHRSISGDKSIKDYSTYEALMSLFKKEEKLLNPELILLRESPDIQKRLVKALESIIVDSNENINFSLLENGININGIPSNASSDGFVSTMNWVLDLFGRAIALGMLKYNNILSGIVLIDELEQHLHPTWQRLVIEKLKNQFPDIQFIITTHTPSIVAGASDFEDSLVFRIEKEDTQTTAQIIRNEYIENKSSGDILLENFGLSSLKSPKSIRISNRYTELQSKKNKTDKEKTELEQLRDKIFKDHDQITEFENELLEKLKKYK
jgi:predicted ATPase